MKSRMKQIQGILICSAIGLSLAACSGKSADNKTTVKNELQPAETGSEALQPESLNNTESGDEEKEAFRYPDIVISSRSYYEVNDDGLILLQGYIRAPFVSEDGSEYFPELANSLNTASKKAISDMDALAKEHVEDAKSELVEYPDMPNFGYTEEKNVAIQRLDDKVLSMYYPIYSFYSGAAHGMYGNDNITYDVKTGKELRLTDVLKDTSRLPELIKDALYEEYADYPDLLEEMESFGSFGADGALSHFDAEAVESWYSDDYMDYKYPYTWVLTPTGIQFYFGPYMLASYAAGAQAVTLDYDKYPEIFNSEYLPENNSGFVYNCGPYSTNLFDLDGDGKRDQLSIEREYDKDYTYIKAITVSVGNKSAAVKDLWIDSESGSPGEEYESYFIHTDDGRNYLYLFVPLENDYMELLMFDLNDGVKYIGEEYYCVAYTELGNGEYATEALLTDPDRLILNSRFDIVATMTGSRQYYIGADGRPKSDDEYFTIGWNAAWEPVRFLKEVKADIVDESGKTIAADETIKPGESFEPLRTDGKTFIDIILSDGRIARLKITDVEYPCYIDGMSAEEIFGNLYYVG